MRRATGELGGRVARGMFMIGNLVLGWCLVKGRDAEQLEAAQKRGTLGHAVAPETELRHFRDTDRWAVDWGPLMWPATKWCRGHVGCSMRRLLECFSTNSFNDHLIPHLRVDVFDRVWQLLHLRPTHSSKTQKEK